MKARGTRKKSPFRKQTHDAGSRPDGALVVLACLKLESFGTINRRRRDKRYSRCKIPLEVVGEAG